VGAALLLAACSKGGEPAAPGKQAVQVGVVTLQPQSQQLDASLPGRTRAF
jgi:membrane fusion protein (multidrug efflux system)